MEKLKIKQPQKSSDTVTRTIRMNGKTFDKINELAEKTKKFITVEVNMGQMINDVRLAVNGKAPVELIHKPVGAPPAPEEIAAQIEDLI